MTRTLVRDLGDDQTAASGADRSPAPLIALALVSLPLLRPHGPAHTTPADVIMAAAIATCFVWARARHVRLHLPYAVPIAIIVASGIVATQASIVPMFSAVAVGQDVFLFMWGAAIANVIRSPGDLRMLLSAWSFGAMAWATILVVSVMSGVTLLPGATYGVRAQLWFDNPNQAGNFFMLSLFVLMLSPWPASRLGRTYGFAIVAAAMLYTGSLAALGAFLAGASVVVLYVLWRRGDLVSALAASAAGLLLLASASFVAVESGAVAAIRGEPNTLVQNSVGRASRSSEGRTNLYAEQLELFRTGPLLGRGPASTKATLARKFGSTATATPMQIVKEAHSDYLAALIERGIVGVLGLLILVIGVAVRASALSHRPLSSSYRPMVRNPAAFVGGAVALGLTAVTHEILHYRHVWAFLGILAGVYLFGRLSTSAKGSIRVAPVVAG